MSYAFIRCEWCDHEAENLDSFKDCISAGHSLLKVYSELLLSDSRGIYIPRDFYNGFTFSHWGLKKADYKALKNPECEWYWEAWNNLLMNAKREFQGREWFLHQDGDLFAQAYESVTQEEIDELKGGA